MSAYLWKVAGEQPQRVRAWQRSSQRQLAAFGIAIHIPVVLWLLTGFLLASTVFKLSDAWSSVVAVGCAGVIYLVERLIVAVPASPWVSAFRLLMGVVIALIGASAVDLVLFEKEIEQQLQASTKESVVRDHEAKRKAQVNEIEKKKADWEIASMKAEQEASGGNGRRGVGPIYAELKRKEELRRLDYLAAAAELPVLELKWAQEMEDAVAKAASEAGLLKRLAALHAFLADSKPWGYLAWGVFFLFVILLELMVLVTKWSFHAETVDETVERLKEAITLHKAKSHHDLVTSRDYEGERLIWGCA